MTRASVRFICASATTRTCGRAGARTVIYVLIHTSRHAQFAYVEGVYSAKKTERRASVCVMRARAKEWKRIRREEGQDVRDEGKGLRRGGVQGQERRDKERTDETTGAGEKEITAGSDRVVEINVARLIGATEECACGLSGSQLVTLRVLRQSRTCLIIANMIFDI